MSNLLSNIFRILLIIAAFIFSGIFFLVFICITLIGIIAFKIDSWVNKRDFSTKDYFKNNFNKAQQQKTQLNSRLNKHFNQRFERFQRDDQTIDISDADFKQDQEES